MVMLVIGLAVFLGIHLLPAFPPVRAAVIDSLGERRYKAAFSLASAIGLALIVLGYAHSTARDRLFAPVALATAIAPLAMCVSFVLLAAANMRSHLRRSLRHPMLTGILIWSGVHLLANGDRTGTVLFGAFFAFALIDLVSAVRRRAVRSFEPELRFDLLAVGSGLLGALAVMFFHRFLFGVRVVPFGI